MKENDSEDRRLLRQIQPQNILSFGPDTEPLPLESLNVLIGPNGAGKSNLIEVLALMRASPIPQDSGNADLRGVVRRGGGVAEWIWKGRKEKPARVELVFNSPVDSQPLRHVLAFRGDEQVFRLEAERIEHEFVSDDQAKPYFSYRYDRAQRPTIHTVKGGENKLSHIAPDFSILAQLRDPGHYPELAYLVSRYVRVRMLREWVFGRNTVFREPQKADMRNDRLEEDFSNLGLFLNRLRRVPKAKGAMLEALRDLYEGLTDFDVIVEGGTVQVFLTEGDFTIPATRLSDGTLRYLCLMAILCDPDPAPLICIEEPELGLHPDMLPKLADRLVAASEKTQIIVTTHSDILVDAMTERPEAVVVCEKHEGRTEMRRLKKEDLAVWLDKYRLGQLWTKGEIGGTRW